MAGKAKELSLWKSDPIAWRRQYQRAWRIRRSIAGLPDRDMENNRAYSRDYARQRRARLKNEAR
jgi:hypothetical protein